MIRAIFIITGPDIIAINLTLGVSLKGYPARRRSIRIASATIAAK